MPSMRVRSICRTALIAVLAACVGASNALAETEGALSSAQGESLLIRPGVGEVAPAAGIAVLPGDTLVTNTDGRVVLLVGTESMLVLGGSAKLSFESVIDGRTFGRRISLSAGALRIAARDDEPVVVMTPAAVIQVRNAYAVIRHDSESGATTILGLAGQTEITDREKTLAVYTVEMGQWSSVERGRPPRIPSAADDETAKRLLVETSLPFEHESPPSSHALIAKDDPLRDWPLKSRTTFGAVGLGAEGVAKAEFEALPLPGPDGFDAPSDVEIDRESEVTVLLIFNNIAEKRRLHKKDRKP